MTGKTAGSRGWQPSTTPKRIIDDGYANSSTLDRQSALCELHGVNLVHRLPPRCPLATPNPLDTLARLQDAGWRVLARGVHDPELSDALALLDAKEVCMDCMDRVRTHRTIRRLRAAAVAA